MLGKVSLVAVTTGDIVLNGGYRLAIIILGKRRLKGAA